MSKKSNKSNKCGPGEIERKGYHRKGFLRNEFVRGNGTIVPASYISAVDVSPVCIKDQGKPGKGPKILPRPGDKIHLSRYGYGIDKPQAIRRAALEAASKDYNTLSVLRRLNLLRNYQSIPENKEIFSDDVEYMQKLYANIRGKNPKFKSKNKQHGGNIFNESNESNESDESNESYESNESDESDIVVNRINLHEPSMVKVNSVMDKETVCDNEGRCDVRNIVYEDHVVDDKKIIFYTLSDNDADEILELDKMYLDSDQTKKAVDQKIVDYRGFLIGIKVDGKLQGYCQYEPLKNSEVKIIWFCSNKGFGIALYTFIEKYFRMNNYTRIIIVVSLEGQHAIRRINFWYQMGFLTYETFAEKKKIHMEKNI